MMADIRKVGSIDILNSDLLADYAAECSIPEIGKINPSAGMYAMMEGAGLMQCFGVYKNEQLIGFASVLTTIIPHYSKKVATLESLFVSEQYRHTDAGSELMATVEHYAKETGCTAILYSAPTAGKLEQVLSRRKAYRQSNSVFVRKL